MNGVAYRRNRGNRAAGYVVAIVASVILIGVPLYLFGVSQGAKEEEKVGKSASAKELQADIKSLNTRVDKLTDRIGALQGDVQDLAKASGDTGGASSGDGASTRPNVDENATGFIKSVFVDAGKRFMKTDYVEFLTGNTAAKARIKDGDCTGTVTECLPDNDYYIRNTNKKIRTWEISKSADIWRETPGVDTPGGRIGKKRITFAELSSTAGKGSKKLTPYRIKVRNGLVTDIVEMFLP